MKNLKLKSVIALFLFVASYNMNAQTPHYTFSGTGELTCSDVNTKLGISRICGSVVHNSTSFTATITGYEKIGIDAFKTLTGLTAVTISSSVTEIDAYAFDETVNLSSLTFEGTIPPTMHA